MKLSLITLFIQIMLATSTITAQPKVGLYSFYLDKEVDFSLMQSFSDDSKAMIQKLVEDPAFNLAPLLADFYDFFTTSAAPLLPFAVYSGQEVTANKIYMSLENHNKYEHTEMHLPAPNYLKLGKSFDESYLQLITSQSLDGLMSAQLQFFVRKNVLKTVIQAQITISVWNREGKKAWSYTEFGISEIGFTTVSGFVVSKQDEVMPMFESAMSNLKQKMINNLASRSEKATKKL